MQHGIREFRPRQPLDRQLSSDTLNRILRELESLRIIRVVNGTFRKLPGGTEITVAPQRGGGTSTQTFHPFQLSQTTGDDPDLIYVRVRYGTVNGEMPTGMSIADDPPYILQLTEASGVVYLGATLDGTTFEINSLWIDQAATLPIEETELEAYLEIGSYSVADGAVAIAQSVTSSLAFIRAGFVNLWGQA